MAEIHGLGSWLGAAPFADKFLLPRSYRPMRLSACSSRTCVTLQAGRRCRAARSHVRDEPSVSGPGSRACPQAQPAEGWCPQCSLQCWAKTHLSHREVPSASFLSSHLPTAVFFKRMQHLLFTPWRNRAFASLLINLGLQTILLYCFLLGLQKHMSFKT